MNPDNRASLPGFLAGLEPLSRRGFLRTSVLAGAAFTAGCSSLLPRQKPLTPSGHHSLNDDEVRVITRLTEVMIPADRYGLPSSTTIVPTIKNVDAMVQRMPAQTRELLGLGIWVFNNRPMVSFTFSRFTKLSDSKALDYVNAMQDGSFFERGLMTTLKALVALNYWRDQRTWPGLEYHGPVTELWGVRRLGNAPLPRV